jgi:hypothetical protein
MRWLRQRPLTDRPTSPTLPWRGPWRRSPGCSLSPLELPSTTCRSAACRRCRRCGRYPPAGRGRRQPPWPWRFPAPVCGGGPRSVPDGLLRGVFGRPVEHQPVDDGAVDDAPGHELADGFGHVGVIAQSRTGLLLLRPRLEPTLCEPAAQRPRRGSLSGVQTAPSAGW